MNKKVISIILSLAMLFTIIAISTTTTAAPIKGKIHYQEDFDGETRNWKPTNGDATLFSLSADDPVDKDSGNYAHIVAGEGALIYKHAPKTPFGKTMIVEFDYKGDNKSSGAGKYVYLGEKPASFGRIYLGEGGAIRLTTRAEGATQDGAVKAELTPNEWHHITWTIDFDGSTQSVQVDDNEAIEGPYYTEYNSAPSIDRFLFRIDPDAGYMDLDNIFIYDPDGVETTTPTPKPVITPVPTKDPNATPTPKPAMLKTLYEEDFEGATRMWTASNNADNTVFAIKNEDGPAADSKNYVHLGSGEGAYLFKHKLNKTPYGDSIIIEFDYRGDNGSGNKYMYLDENPSYGRIFLGKGYVSIWSTKAVELTPDEWHHVKWELNFKDRKYIVTVDDGEPGSADFTDGVPATSPSIGQLLVRLDKDSGYMDLDNIIVYNPEGEDAPKTPTPTPVPTKEPAMFPDTANTTYEKATNAIGKLGIITGYEDGTFGPNKNITRAEFATIMVRSLKLEQDASANNFTDVAADHWAVGYIGAAVKAGIVNGMGDGTFAPNANVTEEQAVKMIVAALGYNDEATEQGGYPNGYIKVASNQKMFTGLVLSAKKEATRGRVAILLNNSLETEIKGKGTTIKALNTK